MIDPIPYANSLLLSDEFQFATDRASGILYVLENGVYQPYGEQVVQKEVCRMGEYNAGLSTYIMNEIVSLVKWNTYVDKLGDTPDKWTIDEMYNAEVTQT